MKPYEVLEKAASLIEEPGKWMQNGYAQAAGGFSVIATDARAVRWCAAGACRKIAGEALGLEAINAYPGGAPRLLNDNDEASSPFPVAAAMREAARKMREEVGRVERAAWEAQKDVPA